VTREELRSQLWPADTFVDFDHSLHNAVGRIREVLGDSAEIPRYIETLPRRGYRFIAPVEEVQAPGFRNQMATKHAKGWQPRPNRAAKQDTCSPGGHAVDSCRYRVSFLAGAAASHPTSAAPRLRSIAYYHSRTYLAIPHRNFSRMA